MIRPQQTKLCCLYFVVCVYATILLVKPPDETQRKASQQTQTQNFVSVSVLCGLSTVGVVCLQQQKDPHPPSHAVWSLMEEVLLSHQP